VKSAFATIARSAVEMLFPARCVGCGAGGHLLCPDCEARSTRLEPASLCRKCALPSKSDICEACHSSPPALDRAVAAFQYDGPVRDAVHALKYDDLRAIAPRLGALMAEAMPARARSQVDALVPVPAGARRLRSRGYNQSALLARQVSKVTGILVDETLLRRVTDAGPQVAAASETERRANVEGVFEAGAAAEGKRLALIDDVMTTGATLNACAAALKLAGASHVSALALCREL
jgi:ComF family protein